MCRTGVFAAAGFLLVMVAVPAVPAGAATPTFTWTGAGVLGGNGNWSNGANWQGGVAPSAPGPVNVTFPAVVSGCPISTSTPACADSDDDLSGLNVTRITLGTSGASGAMNVAGDALTLDNLTSFGGTYSLLNPLTVGPSAATWSLSGTMLLLEHAAGSATLAISMSDGAVLQPPDFATGALSITGANASAAPATNGTLDWGEAMLNSSPAAAVSVENVAVTALGEGSSGPLTTAHDTVSLAPGPGAGGSVFPMFRVYGKATLDAASSIAVGAAVVSSPLGNSTDIGELTATGAINLGSAELLPNAGCLSDGTTGPIVHANGALTGTFTQLIGGVSTPIPNGGIARANPPVTCANGSSADWEIQYNTPSAGMVTATVTTPPASSIAVSTSHTPTIPGRAVVYTATITPKPDGGTVAFSDGSTPVTGCTAQTVNTTTGAATCSVSYTATGVHPITASYSGDANFAPAGPSAVVDEVVVPAPTAAITTASGVYTVGEVIHGTASDAGGPGIGQVIVYYYSYVAGFLGATPAACTGCGLGQTSATWTFTVNLSGIYAFAAVAEDVATNVGPSSNVLYQIVT